MGKPQAPERLLFQLDVGHDGHDQSTCRPVVGHSKLGACQVQLQSRMPGALNEDSKAIQPCETIEIFLVALDTFS